MDLKLLLFFLAAALLAVAAGLWFRGQANHARLTVIRTLSITVILVDFSITPYRVFTDAGFRLNQDLSVVLPVFFCDIVMVVEIVTFCGPCVIRFLRPFAILGALVSGTFVLTDPAFYNPHAFFFDFTQFRSILTHCMLLGLALFAISSGYFTPRLKHLWNVVVCTVVLLAYAVVINWIFSYSVLARENPAFRLNALYMQAPAVPIPAAVGPVIAAFIVGLLFILCFAVEWAHREEESSVFTYYRTHSDPWLHKTVDYFIRQKT